MKNATLGLLALAFPRAEARTNFGIEYRDANGSLIGYIENETFNLNTDYEYYDMAKSALIEHGVNWQDWDEGKSLYE